MQLIAEELSVPFNRVTLIQCDTALTPDQGTTSGAQSHPTNFNQGNLALAGATARETLVQLAATRLGVPADQLVVERRRDQREERRVEEGRLRRARWRTQVQHPAQHERAAQGSARVDRSRQTGPARRHSRPWPPADSSTSTTCACPGCCTGAVVRPPAVGATLVGVDESSVKDVAGRREGRRQEKLRRRRRRKAVAGDAGGRQAEGDVDAGHRAAGPGTFLRVPAEPEADARHAGRQLEGRGREAGARGDESSRRRITIRIRCTHRSAARARSPMCRATRRRSGRRRRRCIRSRAPPRWCSASSPENVRVIFRMGSGCYGVNGADTVSYDAALLSQAVGRPVRVQLARKDEMAWENYGLAYVIDQRAGLDADGKHRRLGPRSVVGDAGRPAGRQQPRQRRHRLPGRLRAGPRSRRERRRPSRRLRQRQQRGSLVRHRHRRRPERRHRHRRQPARADARRSSRRSSPDRCARLRDCRTRSRTNRSSTRSRRQSEGGSGRVPASSPERSPADRRRAGSGEGRELGDAAVAARRDSALAVSPAGRGIVVRAVRRRQRLLRDGRRSRRQPGHRTGRRASGWSSRTTAVRSRIRTG